MIVVIQCAGTKRRDAGHLKTHDGKKVMFVANPVGSIAPDGTVYAHPDDVSDTGATWRKRLVDYNATEKTNPFNLCSALKLYENEAYKRLANEIGDQNTYILSAGWGLIRGDFLTPNYDITFSKSAERNRQRKKNQFFKDICQLPTDTSEPILYFGGKDYLSLFCDLTKSVRSQRTIVFNSEKTPQATNCRLVRYQTNTRTNWHYEAVKQFLDGNFSP